MNTAIRISSGTLSLFALGAVLLTAASDSFAAERLVRSASGATYFDSQSSNAKRDDESQDDRTSRAQRNQTQRSQNQRNQNQRGPARSVKGPSSGRRVAKPSRKPTPKTGREPSQQFYGWQNNEPRRRPSGTAQQASYQQQSRPTPNRSATNRSAPNRRARGHYNARGFHPGAWLASYGVASPLFGNTHYGPRQAVSRAQYDSPAPRLAGSRHYLNSGRGPSRIFRTAQAPSRAAMQGEEMIPTPAGEGMIEYGREYGPEFGNEYGPGFGPGPVDGHGGGCGCFNCMAVDLCGRCRPCGPLFDNASVFAGVHGFKGPVDQGQDSNFGFQEGFQIAGAMPLGVLRNMSYQIGYQATQSQLSGDLNSNDSRTQNFTTLGVFKRRPVGFQWGVAYDWLNDQDTGTHDLNQVRVQLSLVNQCGREIGFWSAIHSGDDTYANPATGMTDHYETIDLYAFFYRWQIENCGNVRLWAGFSGDSDGLFGGDFEVPLSDKIAMQASFNYLIPEQDTAPNGTIEESWNLGFNMVYYFGCKARYTQGSQHRPMFNVADNGTMMVGRR